MASILRWIAIQNKGFLARNEIQPIILTYIKKWVTGRKIGMFTLKIIPVHLSDSMRCGPTCTEILNFVMREHSLTGKRILKLSLMHDVYEP